MDHMFIGCGQFTSLELSNFSFSTQTINNTSEFVIDFINVKKTEDIRDYLFDKIRNLKYFEKKGDIIKFGQKLILVKDNRNYILNLININFENKNNKADCTILEYDPNDRNCFKEVELLLNNKDNINKREINYLIGINNTTKNEINDSLVPKISNLYKIKHMLISDKDDNDIKMVLNDILINCLNNIEVLCEGIYNMTLFGDSCVGKTCLFQSISGNVYNASLLCTIGIDCQSNILNVKTEKKIKLKFTDTAGVERFRGTSLMYARKCDCAILLYDMTKLESFLSLKNWLEELAENSEIKLIYLIENKIDEIDNRMVNEEEAIGFAKKYNLRFFQISCKEYIGIKEFLIDLSNEIVKIQKTDKEKDKIKKQHKKKKK